MQKIIGIDIDGVLTCEEKGDSNIWEIKMAEYFKKDINRFHDVYNFKKAFNLSDEELNGFINKHLEEIYRNVKPAPGARFTLLKLYNLEFKIYLITARKEKYKKLTKKWLEKHEIPYTSLFHEDNKAPLAVEKNIQLFIEDNKNNTLQLLHCGIPVILLNKYHNRELNKNKDLFRVDTWQQIEDIVFTFFNIDDSESII